MNKTVEAKLKDLPREPGVYFHRSKSGEIIYVGKAAMLKNRVRQYFQNNRVKDAKTDALVAEIADVEWMTVETELDALFLESEMIKRYKPRYNILLRDDKSQQYVRINMNDPYPHLSFTRQPMDDGADYFGPYYNGWAVKKALGFLRKVFPYSTHTTMPKRVCLQYHLGLCPGVEEQKISSASYKATLRKLIRYLKGERKAIMREIETDMKRAAKQHDFERAAKLRNQLGNLKALQKQIIFRDREFLDTSKDHALSELSALLGLKAIPRRIEGYDISHMSGTNNVASMVVATNGLADKSEYRKFKMQLPGNNDFAHMREVIFRRFGQKHGDWPKPNLLLIDGGKGQLSAALDALGERGVAIPAVGLAKREEEIVVHKTRSGIDIAVLVAELNAPPSSRAYEKPFMYESEDFIIVRLPKGSHIVKLLQRIRDESHRFAVSYHSTLKRKGQIKSKLDDIPGVGAITRKKLVHTFGSLRGVEAASEAQLVAVLGQKQGHFIWQHLHGDAKLVDND
ncbi:MAG TPA: excinuclease ABC subunit UvrC [Candidatus Saccharimonadales bacterium]